MGQPAGGNAPASCGEHIAVRRAPGELKHLSTPRKRNHRDSLSSGERKGNSPNLFCAQAHRRCRRGVVRPQTVGCAPRTVQTSLVEVHWNVAPKKVTAL